MMSYNLPIVIPSYKRADRVKSKRLVTNPIICVSESEREEYKLYNPEVEIVCHPDSVKGLIPKRNWMLNHFGELFMIDDDVVSFNRFFVEKGETLVVKDKVYTRLKIEQLYELAKMIDAPLFGFAKQSHVVTFKENAWFSLNKTITGCAYGAMNKENMKWNEELTLKEDFWISCMAKYHYRKVLVDNRFYFIQQDTFTNAGGLSEFRNNKTELNNILEFRKTFGECVKLKKSAKNTNSKIKNNISIDFGF